MDTPIACTLPPRERDRRRDELAGLALSREPIAGGERLTFGAAAEHELRTLVAAEAECCPFLRMDLRREGDRVTLDVTGPGVAELLAPRSGPPAAR